jgi:cytochrome c biogenesis protein CcdA
MLRVIGLVVSIGLADSMNPSTIAPGLYLASDENALRDLIQFTAAVFAVYFVGGALIVVGPGEALLALVPHPSASTRYILELIAGMAMLAVGVWLWRNRARLSERQLPSPSTHGRSAFLLGVTITVVELPTALPYFAAVAAIVGSGLGLGHQIILLVLYNACFVLPLLIVIAVVAAAGDQAIRILVRLREALQRHWPALLGVLALLAGAFVAVLGITGLAQGGHGSVAHFSRRLRRVISH